MVQSAPKRQDIPENEQWDLTQLIASEQQFNEVLPSFLTQAQALEAKWHGQLQTAADVIALIKEYEDFHTTLTPYVEFAFLDPETDATNVVAEERYAKMAQTLAKVNATLSFVDNDILALSTETLQQAQNLDATYQHYVQRLLDRKAHLLHPAAAKTLA